MSYFANIAERESQRDPSLTYFRILDERNGCVNLCRCGISIYTNVEYNDPLQIGADQEGFVVLEGRGVAKVGDEERSVAPGDAFFAPVGVPRGVKTLNKDEPLRVFYFHGAG